MLKNGRWGASLRGQVTAQVSVGAHLFILCRAFKKRRHHLRPAGPFVLFGDVEWIQATATVGIHTAPMNWGKAKEWWCWVLWSFRKWRMIWFQSLEEVQLYRMSNDADVIKRALLTSSRSTLCTQEWVRKFCEAPMFTDIVSTSSQKASVSVPSPSPIASHPFGAGRPGSEFDIPHNGHMMR